MIAKTLAIAIAVLAVIGPGAYLCRVAWRRGGTPKKVVIGVLLLIVALIGWLVAPGAPGESTADRVSQFIGAWGLLFMALGLVVIAAAALGKFRPPGPGESQD